MKRWGLQHIGLAAYDYEGTVQFYSEVLEWPIAYQDLVAAPDGTVLMRHVFFDMGESSYISFMCPTPEMPGHPDTWATDINSGLGTLAGAYHFAFKVDSVEELEERQRAIRAHGIDVTEVYDHDWCLSIYLRDPANGLLIEFLVTTREFTADDELLKVREQEGVTVKLGQLFDESPELARRDAAIFGVPAERFRRRQEADAAPASI